MVPDELDFYEEGVDHDELLVSELDDERDVSDAVELADVEAERDTTLFDDTRCAYSGATGNGDGVDVRELRSAGAVLDDPEIVSFDEADIDADA
jgi:hypothetical protein